MLTRRAALAAAALPICAVGCGETSQARERLSAAGVQFSVPRDWSSEDAPDHDALYMMSPKVQGYVYASMLIEIPKAAPEAPLELQLRELSDRFRQRYQGYVERGLQVSSARDTAPAHGVLEYAAVKQGVEVVERFIQVPMRGARQVLVFCSTSAWAANAYLLTFDRFMVQLSVPG